MMFFKVDVLQFRLIVHGAFLEKYGDIVTKGVIGTVPCSRSDNLEIFNYYTFSDIYIYIL